jgi:hypothetical protein
MSVGTRLGIPRWTEAGRISNECSTGVDRCRADRCPRDRPVVGLDEGCSASVASHYSCLCSRSAWRGHLAEPLAFKGESVHLRVVTGGQPLRIADPRVLSPGLVWWSGEWP